MRDTHYVILGKQFDQLFFGVAKKDYNVLCVAHFMYRFEFY